MRSCTPAKAIGPTCRICRPTNAGAPGKSAPGAWALATKARAGASWCAASRAGTSLPSWRRCPAKWGSTSRAKALSTPPTWNCCCAPAALPICCWQASPPMSACTPRCAKPTTGASSACYCRTAPQPPMTATSWPRLKCSRCRAAYSAPMPHHRPCCRPCPARTVHDRSARTARDSSPGTARDRSPRAGTMRQSPLIPRPKPARGALLLEICALTKRFGSFTAIDQVSLKVEPGSVHALLGENGAGKSTLVKCGAGFARADAGSILIDGREQDIAHPVSARALGIGMVYQHFTLAPGMSVAENLLLAADRLPWVLDWKTRHAELRAFLQSTPFSLNLDACPADLAAGEKQKLELLKQLYLQPRLLILDEPTSVLTPQEADQVLAHIRDFAHRGACTVIIITHKFREVMAYADSVTLLRKNPAPGCWPRRGPPMACPLRHAPQRRAHIHGPPGIQAPHRPPPRWRCKTCARWGSAARWRCLACARRWRPATYLPSPDT